MKPFLQQLSEASRWVRDTVSSISVRRDTAPIDTVARVDHFARTRAALIAQKKLYGYLKERMGTRYPKMFDDDRLALSIDIAKMHVFAAALADMTVCAVAKVGAEGRLDASQQRAWALSCYRAGLDENASQITDTSEVASWVAAFEQRVGETLWENVAAGASAFIESPKALIRWAPIADELKRLDREIVENSMRFAWNEVLQDFRARLDADAVAADWIRLETDSPRLPNASNS